MLSVCSAVQQDPGCSVCVVMHEIFKACNAFQFPQLEEATNYKDGPSFLFFPALEHISSSGYIFHLCLFALEA